MIPGVDDIKNAQQGNGPDFTGYSQLFPMHEAGLEVRGILKVFPVFPDEKVVDPDGHVIAAGGGSEASLGWFVNGGMLGESIEIPFMYNPTTYSETRRLNFEDIPVDRTTPLKLFKGSDAKQIKMQLFCDATWGGVAGPIAGRAMGLIPAGTPQLALSLASEVLSKFGAGRPTVAHYCNLWKALILDKEAQEDPVVQTKIPQLATGTRMTVPPFCILAMGSHFEYQVVLSEVSVEYQMFDNFLNPVRATLDVVFEEVWLANYGKDVTQQIPWETGTPYSAYGLRQQYRASR